MPLISASYNVFLRMKVRRKSSYDHYSLNMFAVWHLSQIKGQSSDIDIFKIHNWIVLKSQKQKRWIKKLYSSTAYFWNGISMISRSSNSRRLTNNKDEVMSHFLIERFWSLIEYSNACNLCIRINRTCI